MNELKLCPWLKLIPCKEIENCAWKCENGECAITVIAKAAEQEDEQ